MEKDYSPKNTRSSGSADGNQKRWTRDNSDNLNSELGIQGGAKGFGGRKTKQNPDGSVSVSTVYANGYEERKIIPPPPKQEEEREIVNGFIVQWEDGYQLIVEPQGEPGIERTWKITVPEEPITYGDQQWLSRVSGAKGAYTWKSYRPPRVYTWGDWYDYSALYHKGEVVFYGPELPNGKDGYDAFLGGFFTRTIEYQPDIGYDTRPPTDGRNPLYQVCAMWDDIQGEVVFHMRSNTPQDVTEEDIDYDNPSRNTQYYNFATKRDGWKEIGRVRYKSYVSSSTSTTYTFYGWNNAAGASPIIIHPDGDKCIVHFICDTERTVVSIYEVTINPDATITSVEKAVNNIRVFESGTIYENTIIPSDYWNSTELSGTGYPMDIKRGGTIYHKMSPYLITHPDDEIITHPNDPHLTNPPVEFYDKPGQHILTHIGCADYNIDTGLYTEVKYDAYLHDPLTLEFTTRGGLTGAWSGTEGYYDPYMTGHTPEIKIIYDDNNPERYKCAISGADLFTFTVKYGDRPTISGSTGTLPNTVRKYPDLFKGMFGKVGYPSIEPTDFSSLPNTVYRWVQSVPNMETAQSGYIHTDDGPLWSDVLGEDIGASLDWNSGFFYQSWEGRHLQWNLAQNIDMRNNFIVSTNTRFLTSWKSTALNINVADTTHPTVAGFAGCSSITGIRGASAQVTDVGPLHQPKYQKQYKSDPIATYTKYNEIEITFNGAVYGDWKTNEWNEPYFLDKRTSKGFSYRFSGNNDELSDWDYELDQYKTNSQVEEIYKKESLEDYSFNPYDPYGPSTEYNRATYSYDFALLLAADHDQTSSHNSFTDIILLKEMFQGVRIPNTLQSSYCFTAMNLEKDVLHFGWYYGGIADVNRNKVFNISLINGKVTNNELHYLRYPDEDFDEAIHEYVFKVGVY